MTMTRDFGRRESVQSIPGLDSVLDQYGRTGGPMDRRDMTFSFRRFTGSADLDADYDRLAAWLAPGNRMRLVYQTDSGAQWFTVASNPRIQNTVTAANNWNNGGFQDFTVTWRIRPDWRPRFSQASDVWGTNDGVWGTADGNWGGAFTIPLTSATTNFTVDATGVAGSTLPTLPDTGPVITIDGPYGGTLGIVIANNSSFFTNAAGVRTSVQLTLPFALGYNEEIVLDCARQKFTYKGTPFRPIKDPAQPVWFRIDPGIVNSIGVACNGTSIATAGAIILDWFKKRA
jgi:hypothetical protein